MALIAGYICGINKESLDIKMFEKSSSKNRKAPQKKANDQK